MVITIIVVIYDKELIESSTLKSIYDSIDGNCNLVIVNNGPTSAMVNDIFYKKLERKFNVLDYYEFLDNKPLSILYNDMIKNYKSDYYIILDDDSILGEDYITEYNAIGQNDYDILTPRIRSVTDGCIYYPIENKRIINDKQEYLTGDVFSIGSGLIISQKFIAKIISNYGDFFDEKYAFYGVDMSIFRRILLMKDKQMFQIKAKGTIYHSLSRLDSSQSFFKSSERIIDAALTLRNYYSFDNVLLFIKISLKNIKYLGFFSVLQLSFKTIIDGIHPKNKLWSKFNG
ncbi:hypothetical protein NL465_22515 [Klebsiella pneumoniae]|nr:hypothetical protein [Klebsiella pneumoniae]